MKGLSLNITECSHCDKSKSELTSNFFKSAASDSVQFFNYREVLRRGVIERAVLVHFKLEAEQRLAFRYERACLQVRSPFEILCHAEARSAGGFHEICERVQGIQHQKPQAMLEIIKKNCDYYFYLSYFYSFGGGG